MKTAEELDAMVQRHYWMCEHGEHPKAITELQGLIDEAIAHGMTLAAATAIWQPAHKHCGEIRDAIITARDKHTTLSIKLERELTESQSWVKASMESAAIASSTIAGLESERDTLRKMVDAFAECGDVGDEWLMADYRELPHVRARKTK